MSYYRTNNSRNSKKSGVEYYLHTLDYYSHLFDDVDDDANIQQILDIVPSIEHKIIMRELIREIVLIIKYIFKPNRIDNKVVSIDEKLSHIIMSVIKKTSPKVFLQYIALIHISIQYYINSHILNDYDYDYDDDYDDYDDDDDDDYDDYDDYDDDEIIIDIQYCIPNDFFAKELMNKISSIIDTEDNIDNDLVETYFSSFRYSDYFQKGYSTFSGNITIVEAVAKYWEIHDPISFLDKVKALGREELFEKESKIFQTEINKLYPILKALKNNKFHIREQCVGDPLFQVYNELEQNRAIISDFTTFKTMIESMNGMIELHPRTHQYEAYLIFEAIFTEYFETIETRDYKNIIIIIDKKKKELSKMRKTGHNYKDNGDSTHIPKSPNFINMLKNIKSILSK